MGILQKLGQPITAARAQNRPQRIKQGGGTAAAQNQVSAPPAPFQNPMGPANFQRNRTNAAAMQGVGDGKSANKDAGSRPMSNQQGMRGAGYRKPTNYAGYGKLHSVTPHQFGPTSARGNRHASQVTKARKATGNKPLISPMSNQDFLDGAALYRKNHGGV